MPRLTHLSLFSGIGGIDIAAEWAGFETIAFVEKDSFCQKVLRKHWSDVPILEDIQDVNRQVLSDAYRLRFDTGRPQQSLQGTGQSGKAWEADDRRPGDYADFTVDLITGGFPCQPFSVAGKRRGKEDDRYLWPEMLRVIREIRSTWAVCENVAGLIHMGLDDCVADLESSGYEVQTFQVPACAVNAPHRRDRIFIVAHTERERCGTHGVQCEESVGTGTPAGLGHGSDATNANGTGCEEQRRSTTGQQKHTTPELGSWWAVEPDVGRVAHGVSHRVDRLRALGNAVVPQQCYNILRAIALIEEGKTDADHSPE